jgi:phosphohistidine phosphatase
MRQFTQPVRLNRRGFMELYVIRHADAKPLDADIPDDADRPLTNTGIAQSKSLAQCLQKLGVHLDVVLTSPLLRARQTAEEMLRQWKEPRPAVEVAEELVDAGKRKKLVRLLCEVGKESVAIIGHEPDLSVFIAWLTGSRKAQLELSKAGFARVHCEGDPNRGAGTLIWLVTPHWFDIPSPRHVD